MRFESCPVCGKGLKVKKVECRACGVSLEGHLHCSPILNLPATYQEFIEMFVMLGGSLKEMAAYLDVSYPTVRSRLDAVMAALKKQKKGEGLDETIRRSRT